MQRTPRTGFSNGKGWGIFAKTENPKINLKNILLKKIGNLCLAENSCVFLCLAIESENRLG